MESGIELGSSSRLPFRKPSNDTSQRKYRNRKCRSRSPSSSRSPSPPSPSPQTMSGAWKRERSPSRKHRRRSRSTSRSPSWPSPSGQTVPSAWKKDRNASPASPKQEEVTHHSRGKTSRRDNFYGDEHSHSRRAGSDVRARRSSYHRYGNPDIASEGHLKPDRSTGRHWESDRSRDRSRDRDSDRNRCRDQSKGRPSHRDLYLEQDDDGERKHAGSRCMSGKSFPDKIKNGHDFEPGGTDRDSSRGREHERDLAKHREYDKQSKLGGKDSGKVTNLNRGKIEVRGDKCRESEREGLRKEATSAQKIDEHLDTERVHLDNSKRCGEARTRDRTGNNVDQHLSTVQMDREKDVDKSRFKGRSRDDESSRKLDDTRNQNSCQDSNRQENAANIINALNATGNGHSKETDNFKHGDEHRGHITCRDGEDHQVQVCLKEEDDLRSVRDHQKSKSYLPHGNKSSGSSEKVLYEDKDKGKETSDDQHFRDAVKKFSTKLGKKSDTKPKEPESMLETRNGESGQNHLKFDPDTTSAQPSSFPSSATVPDKTVSVSPDLKGAKGPKPFDSATKALSSEELANNLNIAKLAAIKAAEIVNRNLGAAGVMSTDQKKRLLWGSKKLAAEQECAVSAGVNRWDTVHFSDPERQEKFHKLMGVKADATMDSKKEGEADVGVFTAERQRELQQDLEKQFAAGLRRRDGGKVGLGL